jgi:demethylmenaquinone methyltransferase/2-methoxy-6-polyprenyl-1,4-benzoquinol methylase
MNAGTTPPGIASEEEAARWVRQMFAGVAHRYDLLNHLLSFNIDRYWRRAVVRAVRPVISRPEAIVLDLCSGTGDLAIALERGGAGNVIASDFCHPMLTAAARKFAASGSRAVLLEADALALPLADETVDLVTVAFGLRNFTNYERGLLEIHRVLRPGGMLAVLEFSQPHNPAFAALYGFYSRRILPVAGGIISGSRAAYTYLPESVRKFPGAAELVTVLSRAGFADAVFQRMTGGIVALHSARKTV